MTRFGMDVTLAHPEGYDLIPDVVEVAKNNAKASGGSFRQVTSMEEAFKGRRHRLSEVMGTLQSDGRAY
ncbi:putative aspartate/ornithine carbamoyltransferase [Escherichia coli]|uniref:Putative aspartate/ornithine carbamoyltransferase n=1 Tax=Escherichia coli TaxID=562 RepID=A0A377CVM3_ECOLX|nr:putative aspartate/ornithine carbamoyltransferase [Escherichia coli]